MCIDTCVSHHRIRVQWKVYGDRISVRVHEGTIDRIVHRDVERVLCRIPLNLGRGAKDLNHALLNIWKYILARLELEEIAEIGIEFVVPPPAVEKLPAPIKPPEVMFVEPIMPKDRFICETA